MRGKKQKLKTVFTLANAPSKKSLEACSTYRQNRCRSCIQCLRCWLVQFPRQGMCRSLTSAISIILIGKREVHTVCRGGHSGGSRANRKWRVLCRNCVTDIELALNQLKHVGARRNTHATKEWQVGQLQRRSWTQIAWPWQPDQLISHHPKLFLLG